MRPKQPVFIETMSRNVAIASCIENSILIILSIIGVILTSKEICLIIIPILILVIATIFMMFIAMMLCGAYSIICKYAMCVSAVDNKFYFTLVNYIINGHGDEIKESIFANETIVPTKFDPIRITFARKHFDKKERAVWISVADNNDGIPDMIISSDGSMADIKSFIAYLS